MKFTFVGYSPDEVMKKITSIILDLAGSVNHQMTLSNLNIRYDLYKYGKNLYKNSNNDTESLFSPLSYLKDKMIISINDGIVTLIPMCSDQIPEEVISLMAYYGDNDGNEYTEEELTSLIDDYLINNISNDGQTQITAQNKKYTDTIELAYPAVTRWHTTVDEPNLGTLVLLHIRDNMNYITDDQTMRIVEGKVVMGYFDLFQWKVFPDYTISELMDNPAIPTMEWRSKAINLDTSVYSVEHWDYADLPDVETLRYINKMDDIHDKISEVIASALIKELDKPYTKETALVLIDTLLVKLNELQDEVSHIEKPMYDLNTRIGGRYLEAQYREFMGSKGE